VKKFGSATDPLWYKDAVIYEIHVRAFADSNNDGIGDFPGLMSRLDYLQDLGVTCLWLLPFFPSPLRDDGYDIANYVDVNPSYGTIDDFKQFLDAAHKRGMQVMIELVINHTSDQHPWFKAARNSPPGSPERNMYVWSDTDKLYEGVRIIFTDTEKSNWTWDEVAKQYYWHRFFSHQPDLNFDNPRVMEEVLNAMRFWMDMGVDGLRLDAIPYLLERDGTSCENVPETHDKIKEIRAAIDAEYDNRLILAEANMWPADVRPYFGDGDGSTWRSARKTACPSPTSWRRRPTSPSPASGASSSATTTNSPSKWSPMTSATICTSPTPLTRACASTSASVAASRRS
jgi:maltose alpha-D-glucosyltransferase/alpha-amylase